MKCGMIWIIYIFMYELFSYIIGCSYFLIYKDDREEKVYLTTMIFQNFF